MAQVSDKPKFVTKGEIKVPPLRDLTDLREGIAPGHRLCTGCVAGIILRQMFMAAEAAGYTLIIANATGCVEVCTSIYPHTSWKVPWIHNAFENAAATISGVEAAYKSLKRKGMVPSDKKVKFVALGGDGGTYDIGFQSLSGAMERGHDFIYVCYDNEAYMNTGIQRSSATPRHASTTTQPAGKVMAGKPQPKKWMPEIAAAHGIPYVAQAAPSHFNDFMRKFMKALNTKGPSYLNVFCTCPRGWRAKEEEGILISKLAVETNYWPLFEVEDGKWKINYKPKERKPIEEFLKKQGRFKHMFKPGNEYLIRELQEDVDKRWERLLKLEQL
ncbi:thiamine pyrophosphate-dependent enzyme [Desulfurobacterium sp. TC5-1]|uniref:thiamine pyrophosphate-dependent enzyme n=1 Tax=Desulfurobacterium sp. TC5-1 TaxID=1158318 RepID=UPI0003B591F3|nr:thiamine pyrophosphate-dependent enzyme [Desulfurobacterium sp. TC5-1]